MKHFLLTGGTGLIGTAIIDKLIADNHQVTILSRTPAKVSARDIPNLNAIASLAEIDDKDKIDVVINLAGAPIADKRWTQSRKRVLESSRIELTRNLVDWLAQRQSKPECLISGSAVGWYGDGGEQTLNEESSFHDEYAHQLCEQWEQQASAAEKHGIRVCIVRTGLVLTADGGFLKKMLLPFKLGLGGRLANGRQYMPWIHLNDISRLFLTLTEQPQAKGVFNGCAPNPVSNAEFTDIFAKQLHRKALLPLPATLLKLLFGELSDLLIGGQKAIPKHAMEIGFKFQFETLPNALNNLFPPGDNRPGQSSSV